jgi:hypothetical protein
MDGREVNDDLHLARLSTPISSRGRRPYMLGALPIPDFEAARVYAFPGRSLPIGRSENRRTVIKWSNQMNYADAYSVLRGSVAGLIEAFNLADKEHKSEALINALRRALERAEYVKIRGRHPNNDEGDAREKG